MMNSLITAALIGLMTPVPSVASTADINGCYSTRSDGYVCFVQIADDEYSVAFNHPQVNTQYPTVFYINCSGGGYWSSYGPLQSEQTPMFARAFCISQGYGNAI